MKRFLAILLMLVLPLQFSFAAAASYCEDEVAAVSLEHYGHHDHGDLGEASEPAKSDGDQKPAAHAECGVCHLGCAKVLNAPLALGTLEAELPSDVQLLLSAAQHQPSPLQRPPIALLA